LLTSTLDFTNYPDFGCTNYNCIYEISLVVYDLFENPCRVYTCSYISLHTRISYLLRGLVLQSLVCAPCRYTLVFTWKLISDLIWISTTSDLCTKVFDDEQFH